MRGRIALSMRPTWPQRVVDVEDVLTGRLPCFAMRSFSLSKEIMESADGNLHEIRQH